MEKIEYKYKALVRSQKAFERALDLYKNKPGCSQAELEAYTASVIKHFELFFEMLWKFYKIYLLDTFGTESTGSKTVFRGCFQNKLITEKQLDELIKIVEIRNTTTHVYNEESAQELAQSISNHYKVLNELTNSIKLT